jgi:hypothetical protein
MFTKEELEAMLMELRWSGTIGYNIETQMMLVSQLLDYVEADARGSL